MSHQGPDEKGGKSVSLNPNFFYSSDAGAEQFAIEPDTNQAFRFVTGSGSMQVLHSDTDTGSGKIILIQIQANDTDWRMIEKSL